jgi:hypothetical protein
MDINLHFSDGSLVELEMQGLFMAQIVSAVLNFCFTQADKRKKERVVKKGVNLTYGITGDAQNIGKREVDGKGIEFRLFHE